MSKTIRRLGITVLMSAVVSLLLLTGCSSSKNSGAPANDASSTVGSQNPSETNTNANSNASASNAATKPAATGPLNQASKNLDLELYSICYTSCTQPIRFLDEWESMQDLIENGGSKIKTGYRWFYDKYMPMEDADGCILVTDDVMRDIKTLAKERGYASDWKEFILYRDGDKTGYSGNVGRSGEVYVKCDKNVTIDDYDHFYTSCTRGIKFLDRWGSMEDVINYGDKEMAESYTPFYNKYVSRENEDGYIKIDESVISDIRALAKSRGYTDDWKEFLLYTGDAEAGAAASDSDNPAANNSEREALEAYRTMLSQESFVRDDNAAYREVWASEDCSFMIAYMDKDDIPELIVVGPSSHADGWGQIYTYKGGQVVPIIRMIDPESAEGYYPKTGWCSDFAMWQGYGSLGWGNLDSTVGYRISRNYVPSENSSEGAVVSGYSIGERDCSEEEYREELFNVTSGAQLMPYSFVQNTEEARKNMLDKDFEKMKTSDNSSEDKSVLNRLLNRVWKWEGFAYTTYLVEFLDDGTYSISIKGFDYGFEYGAYEVKDGKLRMEPVYIGEDPADYVGYQPGYRFGSGEYEFTDDNTLVSCVKLPSDDDYTKGRTYTLTAD